MKPIYLKLAGLILLLLAFGAAIAQIVRMTFRASMAGSTLPIQFVTQIDAVDLLSVLIAFAIVVVAGSAIVAIGTTLLAIRDILEEIRK